MQEKNQSLIYSASILGNRIPRRSFLQVTASGAISTYCIGRRK